MRISELIIRLIDWFYRKPVAAILPRPTLRYIVRGGAGARRAGARSLAPPPFSFAAQSPIFFLPRLR